MANWFVYSFVGEKLERKKINTKKSSLKSVKGVEWGFVLILASKETKLGQSICR